MSTRKGRVVLLKDVLDEAVAVAKANIVEKNPLLPTIETVAEQVGVGAVIFHDLKNYRMNDVEFSLEQMMNFEGETGPYVQYTIARLCTLLEKAKIVPSEKHIVQLEDEAWPIVLHLQEYPIIVKTAYEEADPSIIAKYALQLARGFNKYYGNTKILVEDEKQNSRIVLCISTLNVLKDGLKLLGLETPEKM